jgi:hypothetical protein
MLLPLACSSSAKTSSTDAAPHDGGLTIDTKLTIVDGAQTKLDGAQTKDVRDTATSGEASSAVDAIDGSTPADAKIDSRDALKVADAVDVPLPGDARDVALPVDLPMESAQDVGTPDAPPPNSCTNPIQIPMGTMHVDLTVSTDGESHDFDLACNVGGNDVVLSFYLDRPEMVYADTFGTTWDTILAFNLECPFIARAPAAGMIACNDDACASSQSQVFAIMGQGIHYLVLSGSNGESGAATIHFQHAPVTVTNNIYLPEGSGSVTGATSGAGELDVCDAVGPEDCYWWVSCPDYAGGDFSASTCTGTDPTFDVVLSLQIPRTEAAACADGDACGLQEVMTTKIPTGAGMHVLAVDGNLDSSSGSYTLNYTRP